MKVGTNVDMDAIDISVKQHPPAPNNKKVITVRTIDYIEFPCIMQGRRFLVKFIVSGAWLTPSGLCKNDAIWHKRQSSIYLLSREAKL
jgi:hypothetical protein